MMKTFSVLAMGSVVTAGVFPSFPAKIILSAVVLLATLAQATRGAPLGYQDKNGFHSVTG